MIQKNLNRCIALFLSLCLMADAGVASMLNTFTQSKTQPIVVSSQGIFQEQAFQSISLWFEHVLASLKTMGQIRSGISTGLEPAYATAYDVPESRETADWKTWLNTKFSKKMAGSGTSRSPSIEFQLKIQEKAWERCSAITSYAPAYRHILEHDLIHSQKFKETMQRELSLDPERSWKVFLQISYEESGANSDVVKLSIRGVSGQRVRRAIWALKMSSTDDADSFLSTAGIRKDYQASERYKGNLLFQHHFYRTSYYESFSIPTVIRRSIWQDLSRYGASLKEISRNVTLHTGPWIEGITLKERLELIYRTRLPTADKERECRTLLEFVIRTMIQTWSALDGLLFDHGTEDILLAKPDGHVMFLDPHGQSYSGGSVTLFEAIEGLVLEVRGQHQSSEHLFLPFSFNQFDQLIFQTLGRQRGSTFMADLKESLLARYPYLHGNERQRAFQSKIEEHLLPTPMSNRSETLRRLPNGLKIIGHATFGFQEEIAHHIGHYGFRKGLQRSWQNLDAIWRGEINVTDSQHTVRGTLAGIGASILTGVLMIALGHGWVAWWGMAILARVILDAAFLPWTYDHELRIPISKTLLFLRSA